LYIIVPFHAQSISTLTIANTQIEVETTMIHHKM